MSSVSPDPNEQYTPRARAEILTAGGDYFQFADAADPRGMDIETIAHALALTNRFGGHSRLPYSVAEHSVRVSKLCSPENALWGLMHDASEAYLTDVCRPAKALLPDYRRLEERIAGKIATHYGLSLPIPGEVHEADMVMCATEARDLLAPGEWAHWSLPHPPLAQRVHPLDWRHAKRAFLRRYEELTR